MSRPKHDNLQSVLWKQQISRDTQDYTGLHWKKLAKENKF